MDCSSIVTVIIQNEKGKANIDKEVFYNCISLVDLTLNVELVDGYSEILSGCNSIERLKVKTLSYNGKTYTINELYNNDNSSLKLKKLEKNILRKFLKKLKMDYGY